MKEDNTIKNVSNVNNTSSASNNIQPSNINMGSNQVNIDKESNLSTSKPQPSIPNNSSVVEPINQNKKDNGIFIVLILLIIFVVALPFITSYFEGNDPTNKIDSNIVDTSKKEYNTENGMIKVGEESYISISNVKFYNFSRSANNQLKFNILADKSISNVSDLNLYIELYNSGQNLIYRSKFEYKELEKYVVKSTSIQPSNDIYLLTSYVKIIKSSSISTEFSSLTCIKTETTDTYSLSDKVTFNFSGELLTSYNYSKSYVLPASTTISTEELQTTLQNEYIVLDGQNVTNLNLDNLVLSYSVNLSDQSITIEKLQELDAAKTMVNNRMTSKGWTCE